jgi:hypothetical protein
MHHSNAFERAEIEMKFNGDLSLLKARVYLPNNYKEILFLIPLKELIYAHQPNKHNKTVCLSISIKLYRVLLLQNKKSKLFFSVCFSGGLIAKR